MRWILAVAYAAVVLLVATGARAATPAPRPASDPASRWCGEIGVTLLSGDYVRWGDVLETNESVAKLGIALPTPMADIGGQWDQAFKHFADEAKAYAKCSNGADRDLAGAYLALWASILEHRFPARMNHEWQDDLNTSTQLFEKCVTSNYGSNTGGKCQSMVEENIRRKIKWETAAQ